MASLLRSRWAWAVAAAVALASAAVWYLVLRNPLDSRTRAIFAGATRVEVFRLDGRNGPRDDKPRQQGESRIGGFLVTGKGKDQGKEFADELARILSARKTYSSGYAKCYWPGVAFRVWKGEECVDVLICFRCENLYCGPPTEEALENASFWTSPHRADLVRLAKRAFPDDKDIQSLEEVLEGPRP